MISFATAIIVLLTNHGYWVAGEEYSVNFMWAVKGGLPPATVEWVLLAGEVPLAEGQLALPPDAANGATLTLRAPDVRVPAQLTLQYLVREAQGERRQLHDGTQTIRIVPPTDLSPLAPALNEQQLAVWEKDERLTGYLESHGLPLTKLAGSSSLMTTRAQIILVGPDTLEDENAFAVLRDQAAGGASVMLFRQSAVERLGDYRLATRSVALLQWQTTHPLLSDLSAEAWQTLLTGEQVVLQVPADHPALELAFYPAEVESAEPAALDALLLVQAVGEGRIVFCQAPIGDWARDPRSQLFLQSSLHYLLTRPGPTPSPTQRPTAATQPADPTKEKD